MGRRCRINARAHLFVQTNTMTKPTLLAKDHCLKCEELFQPTRRGQKYCSLVCGMEKRRMDSGRGPRPHETRKCVTCGTEFSSSRRWARFCSRPCRYAKRGVDFARMSKAIGDFRAAVFREDDIEKLKRIIQKHDKASAK